MKLCLVGGFLGSGKTTAIVTAGKMLLKKKIPVAILTNDQGSRLVDTAFANSLHIPNEEVKNGCFCCNFEQLNSSILRLNESTHPDIIFAEAVGSCADLVATIVNPLSRFDPETHTSLSVFADGPVLLSSLEGRSSFVSDHIHYIYKKQLEEAGIIIINKSDLLAADQVARIQSLLESEYPGKKLLFQDSRDETSVEKWLGATEEISSAKILKAPDIDYDKYGEGEAALAWLDAFVIIHSKTKAIQKSFALVTGMFQAISREQLAIGHLKFFVQSGNWQEKISYTGGEQVVAGNGTERIADRATILVNARVETTPDQLEKIFFRAIGKTKDQNCHIEVVSVDSFQPGYPKPTYRVPG